MSFIEDNSEKTIIMVDDNFDNKKLYKGLFEKSGFTFIFLETSTTFIDHLESPSFNQTSIVILDYNIDAYYHGIELLKKIREKKYVIPVIIFSSSASEELNKYDLSNYLPAFNLDKVDFNGKKLLNFCKSLLLV